jgi:NAD(P) transhydrogenase
VLLLKYCILTGLLDFSILAFTQSVALLVKPGLSVIIEENAGLAAHFNNSDYEAAGAKIVSVEELYNKSNVIIKVRPPTPEEATKIEDKTLLSFIYPAQNSTLVEQLQKQKATVFAMDCIPRTLSRGQTFDALSSQANISGYRAVIEASNEFGRFFAG